MKPSRSEAFTGEIRAPRRSVWRASLAIGLVLYGLGLVSPGGSAAQALSPVGPPQSASERTPATECCLVLLLPVGARAVALGRALTAMATPDAVFANPAGLAGLESDYFVLHHTAVAGQATAVSILLTPNKVGTVGISYQLFDFGEVETTDDQGRTIGSLALRHHLLVASFATPIAGGLAAGLNYKLYRFRVGCNGLCGGQEVTATTQAIDAGFHFRSGRIPALQLGAAVTHVGFALQVVNAKQADPLPTRIRIGAAYEVLHHLLPDDAIALWLALDVEDQGRDPGSPVTSIGLELIAHETAFLRAGYVPGDGVGTGASVGIGLRYTRFMVSIAKSFTAALLDATSEPVQVSFGLTF